MMMLREKAKVTEDAVFSHGKNVQKHARLTMQTAI